MKAREIGGLERERGDIRRMKVALKARERIREGRNDEGNGSGGG